VDQDQQKLEAAKRSASSLVSVIDLLGEAVTPTDIQRAALVPLSPLAVQAVFNLACAALANLDGVAAVLAGRCPDQVLELLADFQVPPADMSPLGRRSRR
jgi:hypothetical protein